MNKTAGMRIRVEPELREAFGMMCNMSGTTAAASIRQHMREVVGEFIAPVPSAEDRLARISDRLAEQGV